MRIKSATISPLPKKLTDPNPVVTVILEDDSEHRLFDYYSDELHFEPHEFVGLTIDEAHELKFKKDKAYLQSP